MAILASTGFYGFVCSMRKKASGYVEHFLSGFGGYGWKIWKYGTEEENPEKGLYKLEIDNITVRRSLTVYELLIQKIRAVKGSLAITQASGKIKTVEDKGTYYDVRLEEEMSFMTNDYVRCQTFSGSGIHGYHVKVTVEGDLLKMPKGEFSSDSEAPRVGDELVQFGNSSNTARQSAIYLHADESGKPALDVMFGIDSKDWSNCVKIRLGGGLPGQEDTQNGFYCENGTVKSVSPDGQIIYQFYPDGSFNLGKGKIRYDPAADTLTFGQDVVLTWENLSQDAQENLKGEPGKDGETPYLIDLSNENASVSCDYEGNVVGSIPGTKATVYKGSVVDTGWVFDASFTGCRGAYSPSTGSITITVLEEDTATVLLTASKSGHADLQATYTLSKVRGGSPGEAAVVYWLEPSVSVVKKDKDGILTPPAVTCVKMKQKGNEGATITTEKTLKYQLSTGVPSNYTGAVAVGTATWIDFILYEGSTVLDRERVPVVKDGETGPQGVVGERGEDGTTYYTWIRYADDVLGNGISNNPSGKAYMGLAYNQTDPLESDTPSDYQWSRFRGENGTQGVAGPQGEDGTTYYTWIAYSDHADGSGMYQVPNDNTKYIGIAVNQVTPDESNTPSDYTWSKFKGEEGKPGKDANLLDWVQNWDSNATEIDGIKVVSPRIFSGKRELESGKLTGIAIGRVDYIESENERVGIYGYKDQVETFSLDARTGGVKVLGSIAEVFHRMNYTEYHEQLGIGETAIYFDFNTGFNWALTNDSSSGTMTFHLPLDAKYNGTRCNVVNIGTGIPNNQGRYVEIESNMIVNRTLKIEGYPENLKLKVVGLRLPLNGVAQFYAIPDPADSGSVNWVLMNASDFIVIRMNSSQGGYDVYLQAGSDLLLPTRMG